MMHGNEPLEKLPNTQIKMEQPQHSLAPHLDSFTKSTPNLSPPKPHHNVLKTAASSLSLGCACLGMSRARRAEEKVLCGWKGKWWAAGNLAGRELSSLISCHTPLSDLHLSVHLYVPLVRSSRVRSHLFSEEEESSSGPTPPGSATFTQTHQCSDGNSYDCYFKQCLTIFRSIVLIHCFTRHKKVVQNVCLPILEKSLNT